MQDVMADVGGLGGVHVAVQVYDIPKQAAAEQPRLGGKFGPQSEVGDKGVQALQAQIAIAFGDAGDAGIAQRGMTHALVAEAQDHPHQGPAQQQAGKLGAAASSGVDLAVDALGQGPTDRRRMLPGG